MRRLFGSANPDTAMPHAGTSPVSTPNRYHLLLVISFFGLAIAIVDPGQETPMHDDWAYAETVKHLAETGEYRLNDWLSANMPFLAYWGLAFSAVGGYSFVTLRLSVAVLSLAGLFSLYSLAKEHGLNRSVAALLALCVASSPLYFRYSFHFMTDVPFLSTTAVAIVLYTKAFRKESRLLMVSASAAAAAAILTRQFGAALVGAVFVLWIVDRDRSKKKKLLYALGLALPSAATAWQIRQGIVKPNWAAEFTTHLQISYLQDLQTFLPEVAYRPTIILHYIAWFLIPLVVLGVIDVFYELRRREGLSGFRWAGGRSLAVAAIVLAVGLIYGGITKSQWLMPFLPWNFKVLYKLGAVTRVFITIFTFVGALLFARIFILRYCGETRERLTHYSLLLDLVTLFSLLGALAFVQIGDEYLLIFIPYGAIVVGRYLQQRILVLHRPLIACCVLLLLGSSFWTHDLMAPNAAIWREASRTVATGIPPCRIYAGWMWAGYHCLSDFTEDFAPTSATAVRDYFGSWLPQRQEDALFRVAEHLRPCEEGEWALVSQSRFFSFWRRGYRTISTFRRVSPDPGLVEETVDPETNILAK